MLVGGKDVDFHKFLVDYTDRRYPIQLLADDEYRRKRDFFTLEAFNNAFGRKPDWDPEGGFAINRATMVQLYDYYRDLYLRDSVHFLWAGLARMAGCAVLEGLDHGTVALGDATFMPCAMVLLGKYIFFDLAWLHEAFLENSALATALAAEHDARYPARRKYAEAFAKMATGDSQSIIDGNRMVLENEQFSIVQPIYDVIVANMAIGEAVLFDKTSAFARVVHPYHRPFLIDLPLGDIRVANDRWRWINLSDGMLEKWVSIPRTERERLVGVSMSDALLFNYGAVLPEYLPLGGP